MTYDNKNFDYTNILGILALTAIGLTLHKKDSCKNQKKYIIKENKDFLNLSNSENANFITRELTFGKYRYNNVLVTGTKESLLPGIETDLELYTPEFILANNPVEKFVAVGEKFDWINDEDFKAGRPLLIRDANIDNTFDQKKLNKFTISNYISFDTGKQYVYGPQAKAPQWYYIAYNPVIFIREAFDSNEKTFLADYSAGDTIYQPGTIFNV
jgi:hypothetical protein